MSSPRIINHSPIIITGMHRSGTSLTASILKQCGIDIGSNLFSADQHNRRGYFEDVDFLEFQRKLLRDSCGDRQPGWIDWGWTAEEKLNRSYWENSRSEAQDLIYQRQVKKYWGWKDPRTTLILDFWKDLLPNAKFILVYRFPWDVSDSIFRIGHPYFLDNADMGIRAWFFYNWHLLDFYCRHSDQAILFNINSLLQKPDFLGEALVHKLGFDPESMTRLDSKTMIEPGLMRQMNINSNLVQGLNKIAPRYAELLGLLDYHSDLPSNRNFDAPLNFSVQEELKSESEFPERYLLSLYSQNLQQERQYAQDSKVLGERLHYLESALKVYEQSRVTRGYVRLKRRFFDRFQK
ncbi:MAG: sulfotransferase family protein [Cyanophyceae cyanobacterium]